MEIVVSFYKFKRMKDLDSLRSDILTLAMERKLKGTVLLADEGINASVAGPEDKLRDFLDRLQNDSRIGKFAEEKSNIADLPTHRRMLVKIKKEIVTMHKEGLIPEEETGHYVTPQEFKSWCDQGKEMILVDTRNDYEVALGSFKDALDPKTKSFGEFPQWVEEHLSQHKDATIVTFCTGGIRCEKATAYMRKEGFQNVFQIKGGILQYLSDMAEENQAPHWQGDCVVFDKRMAVQANLLRTEKELCFHCFTELVPENRAERAFSAGFLCKSCCSDYLSKQEERAKKGLEKQQQFRERRTQHCREMRKKWESEGP